MSPGPVESACSSIDYEDISGMIDPILIAELDLNLCCLAMHAFPM